MGLQDSVNTRIGRWGVKGLSGGRKRRVSIWIEVLTRSKLLFLVEPTSGLDSEASYYVMSRIARLDQGEGRTIITSIHQPSSEVFAVPFVLWENISKQFTLAPARSANEFFVLNGFPCLTLQNPSDHFLIAISKDFDEDIEQGSGGRKPTEEVIEVLINSYQSSSNYQESLRRVAETCKKGGEELEQWRSHVSFITRCVLLTRRSSVNMFYDLTTTGYA